MPLVLYKYYFRLCLDQANTCDSSKPSSSFCFIMNDFMFCLRLDYSFTQPELFSVHPVPICTDASVPNAAEKDLNRT